jgi:hypothetical protein
MPNRVEYGDDIQKEAKSTTVRALYARWKMLTQLGRLTLSEFMDRPREQTDRYLLVMRSANEWLFVHQGSAFRADLGVDLAGKTVREIENPVADRMGSLFDQVADTGIPVRIVYASLSRNSNLVWERLILPIPTREPDRPLLLVYSEPINSILEVYHHLFTLSPDVLVAAFPALSPDGRVIDASLVFANARAEQVLVIAPDSKSPHALRGIGPWFNQPAIWDGLLGGAPGDRSSRSIDVEFAGVSWHIVATWLDQIILITARPGRAPDLTFLD